MKQANDLREENLLLTQACADRFWSERAELSAFLHQISAQLAEIHPNSTSPEHIQHEQEKYQQLFNDTSAHRMKFQEILQDHSLQLLALLSNNSDETHEIHRALQELEQQWNEVQTDLNNCGNELAQAMIKSTEFNAKLERVSTWFDDAAFPAALATVPAAVALENSAEFERIRTFKEHLDCKYIDMVHLKQDYTDIEHCQHIDEIRQQEADEKEKATFVEEQLVSMDSKWTQLNGQIQEQ